MPAKILLVCMVFAASGFLAWQGVDPGMTSAIVDYGSIENNKSSSSPGIDPVALFSKQTPAVSLVNEGNNSDASADIDHDTSEIDIDWPLTSTRALPYPSTTNNDGIQPVIVAILDTGIDETHEELIGKVIDRISMVEGSDPDDHHGHGTFIAGIIAADVENNIGIEGAAPECRLLNVKVANDRGQCRHSDLAEGIVWAVDNGAWVINISIEMKESTTVLEAAIDYAWDHGVIIVAAAGNEGADIPVYPAAYSSCISSTAVRDDLSLAPLANYGDWIDVAAPGYDIYATLPGDEYGYEYGTSFAAAYVSGLAARICSLVEDENMNGTVRDEVIQAITGGCRDIGVDGTGQGIIDFQRSMDIFESNYHVATDTTSGSD